MMHAHEILCCIGHGGMAFLIVLTALAFAAFFATVAFKGGRALYRRIRRPR